MWKSSGGWRFTIDYRTLNKVITKEGLQITNMKEMLQSIGPGLKLSEWRDLTKGFYHMPHTRTVEPTLSYHLEVFISGRGFQWDSFRPKISSKKVYRTYEVYIDNLLFHGQNDEDFILNTREIFQICRNKGVILSAKKLLIGMTKVPFVGHEVDSLGLNMSQT